MRKQPKPAITVEGRERQLIAASIELAAAQIASGKISAQVLLHYVKLGGVLAEIELEKAKLENALLVAKTEAIRAQQANEKLFGEAIQAMSDYRLGPSDEL